MMANPEGSEKPREPRRARQGKQPQSPVTVSPSARLDVMTRERIDSLDQDKQRLREEVERLQARVDQLSPENARLEEALRLAESNNILATILTGLGGFLVSYATFTGKAAQTWANGAAGILLAGIVMMLFQTIRRSRSR